MPSPHGTEGISVLGLSVSLLCLFGLFPCLIEPCQFFAVDEYIEVKLL